MKLTKIRKGKYETSKGEITIESGLGGWEVSPNTDEVDAAIGNDNHGVCPKFETLREAIQYCNGLLLSIQQSK